MEEKRDSVKAKTNSKAGCERKPNGRGGSCFVSFSLFSSSSSFFNFLIFLIVFSFGFYSGPLTWDSLGQLEPWASNEFIFDIPWALDTNELWA